VGLRVEGPSSDDVGVESKGVRSGVERRRGVSGLKAARGGRRDAPGEKVLSLRIGVHHADAVVWEPV
jgi:hypothetical protein